MSISMTPNMKLAGILLGRPVTDWIADRREAGDSWRRIELALEEATNGQIRVEHETLRRWSGLS